MIIPLGAYTMIKRGGALDDAALANDGIIASSSGRPMAVPMPRSR
jgi:hypothetical protein